MDARQRALEHLRKAHLHLRALRHAAALREIEKAQRCMDRAGGKAV